MARIRIVVSALVAGLLCRAAAPASACSCDPLTIPELGATEVPTNLREILVRWDSQVTYELRELATGR
ncbi:MAG: hypothetical protein M3680_23565 [Myxococcota bacterium]|nr:hypothetical protein [Myxococcota bacterium]